MELVQLKQKRPSFDAGLSLAPPCGSLSSRFSSSLTTTTTTSSNNSKESSSSLDCSSTRSGGADELDCSSFLFAAAGDKGGLGLIRKRKREGDALLAGLMRDVELHQSAGPLPTGWQQCLDLQSGEVYYYNPTLQIKTKQDPRKGFAGLVRNDWNPRRNPQDSQQLQKLEQKRIHWTKFGPQFEDDHHLDLTLSLNLFPKQQAQQEQQRQNRELSRRPDPGLSHRHNLIIPQWMQREILAKHVMNSSSSSISEEDSSAGSGGMLAACRNCLRFVMLPRSSRNCPCCGQLCAPYEP